MDQRFLTEQDLSQRLRVSVHALRKWRLQRRGPPYLKLSTLVRYPLEGVKRWLAARPSGGDQLDGGTPR